MREESLEIMRDALKKTEAKLAIAEKEINYLKFRLSSQDRSLESQSTYLKRVDGRLEGTTGSIRIIEDNHETRIAALEQFVEMTGKAAAKTMAKPKESHAFTRDFCGNN